MNRWVSADRESDSRIVRALGYCPHFIDATSRTSTSISSGDLLVICVCRSKRPMSVQKLEKLDGLSILLNWVDSAWAGAGRSSAGVVGLCALPTSAADAFGRSGRASEPAVLHSTRYE